MNREDIRDIENFKPRTHQERVDKLMIELLSDINSKLDRLMPIEAVAPEEPVQKKTRRKKTEEVK